MRLIIATKNSSKMKEIRDILSDLRVEILSLLDLPEKFLIVEDGETFFENAMKKSISVSNVYRNDYVVGEDSGIEVEHLKGKPGVHSKRYSGKDATDLKNNYKLLKKLNNLPIDKRKARFVCCLSLAKGGKEILRLRGDLRGRIYNRLVGREGFGYDPLFYLPQLKKTTAQLAPGQKNKISHRTKAFLKLKEFLLKNRCTF